MKNQSGWPKDQSAANEQISQVLSMDDDRLRAAVRAIVEAGGMSGRRADAMTRDADAIRRKLSSIRAEDMQKLLAQISPEQMAALTEQLQKLKNKEN